MSIPKKSLRAFYTALLVLVMGSVGFWIGLKLAAMIVGLQLITGVIN